MIFAGRIILFIFVVLLLPPFLIGIIRKTKAIFQNRIGAPVYQPILDLVKMLRKKETISNVTSFVFRWTVLINLATVGFLAFIVPWLSFKPNFGGADLFLVIYLFAVARFFTILSSFDTGSAFCGFGASREATLALLIEPAIVLCLVSLGVTAQTSNLSDIFSYTSTLTVAKPGLWLLAGVGLFLASLVELSRMPTDDPTTHLELTMVHEAMILENSARNLALVEFTHYLKMTVLLGLTGQCFLHANTSIWRLSQLERGVLSIAAPVVLALVIAIIEATSVKSKWTKVPEFIAYAITMGLLCLLTAVGKI